MAMLNFMDLWMSIMGGIELTLAVARSICKEDDKHWNDVNDVVS